MNMQKSHIARKTTAILSAIATSSLLGLPALAGNPVGVTNAGTNQAQTPSNVDQTQCVPSNQANQPSTTATPDASAPEAAQLPNQSDPRAGIAPSDQTAGNRTVPPTTNASGVQSREAADTSRQTTSYRRDSSYRNVLSQGGATAGGFASQQVSAANNPDAYRSASSRISSNEDRPNYYGSTGTDGTVGSTMSSNNSMRSTTSNQPYSQSSRATTSTTVALCPSGTIPQSATPSTRQAPSQPNLDTQPSSPQASPQQPGGNETRQSPADDNSGGTR